MDTSQVCLASDTRVACIIAKKRRLPTMNCLSDKLAEDPGFRQLMLRLARRYVWWETPDTSLQRPEYVVSRVMDMGDYADIQALAKHVDDEILRDILQNAEIGQFSPRSWAYWHYRLGLPASKSVPPMPKRRLA